MTVKGMIHFTAIAIIILAIFAYWAGHTGFFRSDGGLGRFDHLGYVFNGTGAAEVPLYQ